MDGLFQRFGNHERDWLPLLNDPIVLEHVEALADCRIDGGVVLAIGEPRRVPVRQNDDDPGHPLRRLGIDRSDPATRDGAAHDRRVRLAGHIELGGIGRAARHLLSAVEAAGRLPDNSGGHVRAPAISTARTMARCMS